jgi:hypothetical protein
MTGRGWGRGGGGFQGGFQGGSRLTVSTSPHPSSAHSSKRDTSRQIPQPGKRSCCICALMNMTNEIATTGSTVCDNERKERSRAVYALLGRKHGSAFDQRYYIEKMLQRGRCKHQVLYLAQKFDLDTLRGLAKLKLGPERRVDHTPCANHPSCLAYNVNLSSYRTAHRDGNCNCELLSVPYDELVAGIEQREIPLISIEHSADLLRPTTLRLHRRERSSKYTAISHVWADGLGNPPLNALPTCQLEYLAARFGDLHDSPEVS